jgi:predicted GNAT family acetyltransferase
MIDDWFRTVRLKITIDEFHRLPRTLGYKHEYYGGQCVLTPRPKNCYAVLNLAEFKPPPPMSAREEVAVRPPRDSDWEALGKCCGFAFHRIPPFDSLNADEKRQAGRDCMEHTRNGGDGPLIAEASMVAVDEKDEPLGALLIVVKPAKYSADPWHHDWRGTPPADAVASGGGQAHLDWVFVSHWHVGRGVASSMLAASIPKLREMNYESLTSTFMLGNGESMAWHWRNGFVLLPNPASMRYFERRMKDAGVNPTKP